jgi:putative DNA primase/helicase
MGVPSLSPATERVLGKLKNVKRAAGGWVALCPGHDDKQQSLSIGQGTDGRVIMKCHAGCDTKDIVGRLGLTMAELFAEPRRPAPAGPARQQRMVKSYDYTDADGTLLFQTCRFEPKTFRQRRPDGNGGWIWSLGDTPPVLYRLPEVAAAVADGKRVFVVEGEKDADAITAFGYTATTSPMGAGKWREAFSDALNGAEVVILPDNDDPGRAHAEQIAASLLSRGCVVRVVNLPNLPEKGDVSDWLAIESNSLDSLEELIGKTPRWSPDGMTEKRRVLWRLDELWENDSIMRPPPAIVPRLAWAGRSTLLAAREKIGKSTLVGYIAAKVSSGGAFLGQPCAKGDVLIVTLEEYPGDTARRLRTFDADAGKVHLLLGFSGDPHERPQELGRYIEELDPILVIIDTLAAYSHGLADDDNSAVQMTGVLQPISRLAHENHVALILVHHAKKTDGRARGSTAITAGTDVVVEIDVPDEDTDPTRRRVRSVGRVPVEREYHVKFDGDTYTLDSGDAPLDMRITEFIRHHPGTSIKNLRDMVKGRYEDITATVSKLVAGGMILNNGEGRASQLYLRMDGNRAGT